MNKKLPVIGFGTFPYKEELIHSIPLAYEAGFRMFDTSDNYNNEEYVGQAIKGLNDVILISKFSSPLSAYYVKESFAESTKKLGRVPDYYLMHWPYPFLWKIIWRQMEKLYLDGEVSGIGVCNFNEKKLKELLAFSKVKPVIDQFERHPLFQQNGLLNICQENDIYVMSYSPIGRRDKLLLTNEYLLELSNKYHKTVEQIILKWGVSTNSHPIPSSKSKQHIDSNINIFDFELSDIEICKINELDIGHRTRFDPNTRFSLKQKIKFLNYKYVGFVKTILKKIKKNNII